jgi:hypothetical protein
MTDGLVTETSVQSQVQSQEPNTPASETRSVEKAQTPSQVTQVQPEKPAEKMLRQSEVNDLVGSIRKEAYEKGKREAAQVVPQQQNAGDANQMPDDRIRHLIQQESARMTQEAIANKVAQEFVQKMEASKDKYPDFEQSISKLNLPSIPQIVNWSNSLDNTADVMYDIAKHPAKFANLLMLSHTAPHLAVEELQNLSASIKQNSAALKQQTPAEPLSQIKPSTTGTDNGSMNVSDLRKQSWLRG